MTDVEEDDGRLVKRSVVVAGHRTSISLENLFWRTLRAQAAARGLSVAALVGEIDAVRAGANLSSALRVHALRTALGGQRDPAVGGTKHGACG